MNRFNSKVCTSVKQSKRLLELGLKPKTADMFLFDNMGIYTAGVVGGVENNATLAFRERKIPAWSLHRLILLCGVTAMFTRDTLETAYDDQINAIENLIKNGCFNKEYLKQ